MFRTGSHTPKGRALQANYVVCDELADLHSYLIQERSAGRLIEGWACTERALKGLHTGDDSLVERSSRLLDKIEAEAPLDLIVPYTERAMCGGLADVPAYLSGSPVAMRMRRKREAPRPLTIVVDVTSASMYGNEVLERRGVAVLALLRKLEASGVAVTLYVVEAPGGVYGNQGFAYVKMDTQPLDLTRSCWALASADFSRECGYSACRTVAREDWRGFPWGGVNWFDNLAEQARTHGAALGLDPESLLVMGPLRGGFEGAPFQSDTEAAEWVAAEYMRAMQMQEEAL